MRGAGQVEAVLSPLMVGSGGHSTAMSVSMSSTGMYQQFLPVVLSVVLSVVLPVVLSVDVLDDRVCKSPPHLLVAECLYKNMLVLSQTVGTMQCTSWLPACRSRRHACHHQLMMLSISSGSSQSGSTRL